jgi:hypothetical protein
METLNIFNSQFTEHKRYTVTSFFYTVTQCQLSATLQTMSIIAVTLKDNRVVFGILTAPLRFSVVSPSYILLLTAPMQAYVMKFNVKFHNFIGTVFRLRA